MALKPVHSLCVTDDLTGTTCTGCQYQAFRRQPRHVVVPMPHRHAMHQLFQVWIIQTSLCQGDGKDTNLLFRAVFIASPQRLSDELCTQANTKNTFTGLHVLPDKRHFSFCVVIRAFFQTGIRTLRASHHHK